MEVSQSQPQALPQGLPIEGASWDAVAQYADLQQARQAAWAAYSNYRVGVVAVGQSGRRYYGANVEVSPHMGVCAEFSALAMARRHGETRLSQVVLTDPPCGRCRQFMLEAGRPDLTVRWLVPTTDASTDDHAPIFEEARLDQLMPHPFTWAHADRHCLNWPDAPTQSDLDQLHAADPALAALTGLVRLVAEKSYAPYTGQHSGVVLVLSNQQPVRAGHTLGTSKTGRQGYGLGGVIESSVTTMAMPALLAAVFDALSQGFVLDDVTAVLLTKDKSGLNVDQTRLLMTQLGITAPLSVV
ncbi:MAG: hypothetical protein KC474_05025 [Cyanobacteria bacterium HKST-UBA04]|nr:hypothetical protein [Cyanobacteria bacterium HKST-UBA04]MCA9841313.1 hypothetical protein [Cyanobacteria bacterium HKST-UBA03]